MKRVGRKRMHLSVALTLALVTFLLGAGEVAAVTLNPGDIVVVDAHAFGSGGVIRVDPTTGAQAAISNNAISTAAGGGGLFVFPVGVAIDASGDILVSDISAFGGGGGIIRVDPITGAQTAVSSNAISTAAGGGAFFMDPVGIAIEASGAIVLGDITADAVIRVNPVTGAQTVVSSGGLFATPGRVAVEVSGSLIVADQTSGGSGRILRVDPSTGVQSVVSSGGFFGCPTGMGLDADGDILATTSPGCTFPRILSVDPTTGAQTSISSGGLFSHPEGVAVEATGQIVVGDTQAFGGPCPAPGCGGIIRVDPISGAQSIVSNNTVSAAAGGGEFFVDPGLLAIVPAAAQVPEPGTLLLLASGLAGLGAWRWRKA